MMAGTTRRSSKSVDATPEPPMSSPLPHVYGAGHDFTLQAVMEMQKSIGAMESSIANLGTQIEGQKSTLNELKAKAGHVEKVMYAAGVILVGALVVGGWIVSSAKDFAMTYYKASLDSQGKIASTTQAIQPSAQTTQPPNKLSPDRDR